MKSRAGAILLVTALALSGRAIAAETDAALQARAFEARARRDFPACACAMDEILFERGEASIGALYFGATCYAASGQVDKAFVVLAKALFSPVDRNQYFNFERLDADPALELDSLRSDPRWRFVVDETHAVKNAYLATEDSEIFRLYVDDQRDRWRRPLDPNWLTPRDRLRRERTRELIRAGRVRSAEDFNEAALIFQHADDYVDVGFGHELAAKAVSLDPETFRYRWLVAATLDRYLWYKCEPQIYGTQFKLVDGKYTIEPIDADLIDDEERIRWGVPTLAQAHEREKRLNATLKQP